jgi:hypothetical protein
VRWLPRTGRPALGLTATARAGFASSALTTARPRPYTGRSSMQQSKLPVWRAANLMIEMFGEDAALKAAMRTDALLEQGDTEGFFAWKRITRAIGALCSSPQNKRPDSIPTVRPQSTKGKRIHPPRHSSCSGFGVPAITCDRVQPRDAIVYARCIGMRNLSAPP